MPYNGGVCIVTELDLIFWHQMKALTTKILAAVDHPREKYSNFQVQSIYSRCVIESKVKSHELTDIDAEAVTRVNVV